MKNFNTFSEMPEPEKTAPANPEPLNDQPPREISQTDHINKKLLTSLFKRMDEEKDSPLAKMLEPDSNDVEEQDWD